MSTVRFSSCLTVIPLIAERSLCAEGQNLPQWSMNYDTPTCAAEILPLASPKLQERTEAMTQREYWHELAAIAVVAVLCGGVVLLLAKALAWVMT